MPYALRHELWSLLRLAGPLIAAQIAHVLMAFTDTLMMAKLGPLALAGGALGSTTYTFTSVVCMGVMAAVGTLAAIRHGAGDTAEVTRLTQAGLWVGWGLAALAALLLWNIAPLLRAFGQEPTNVESARQFLLFVPLALPGFLSFMVLRGFTSAIGRTGPIMAIAAGGALANYLLNDALIEGWFGLPHFGLAGIGLVTALVSNCMAWVMALHVRRHPAYAPYSLRKGLGRPQPRAIRDLLRLGLPIGGTYAVESALFAFGSLCMGALGNTQMAAHQIALQSVIVAFMVPVGLSYALSMRIGQHLGGGRLLEVRRAGRLGIGFGALCMLGFATLFWLAPGWVVGLYLNEGDIAYRDIVALAIKLLAIAALFELFDGIQSIAMGAIRGLRDARTTFLMGLFSYWAVGAPVAWLLAFHYGWGAQGVWWGLAIGLAVAAIGLTLAFEYKCSAMLAEPQRRSALA